MVSACCDCTIRFCPSRRQTFNLGPFDLKALAAAIKKVNWSGWLVVEEENAVNKSGDDAVRPAREALRAQFGF